jgi:hypothetical protein
VENARASGTTSRVVRGMGGTPSGGSIPHTW